MDNLEMGIQVLFGSGAMIFRDGCTPLERQVYMPTTLIEPEVFQPELEMPVQENPLPTGAPKPSVREHRFRKLLVTIFAGHEEYLGWTPD
jgi:hypothetical protein